jgi:hypothetical protein
MRLFFLVLLLIPLNSFSQKGFKYIQFGGGLSYYNMKSAHIGFDWSGGRFKNFSIYAEAQLFPQNIQTGKYNGNYSSIYYSLNSSFKFPLYRKRKFTQSFFFGAGAGILKKRMFYYPLGGFEQSYFFKSSCQLFFSERIQYFLKTTEKQLQPSVLMGLKFPL